MSTPKKPVGNGTPGRAERLADYLFTNGDGDVADRLVLVQEWDRPGSRDLGGWSRAAVVAAVRKFYPEAT